MPYIKQEVRKELDSGIKSLADKINDLAKKEGDEAAFAGLLNYTCTKLTLKTIPARRYKWIAMVCGVFSNIIHEFYRRYAAPYEEEKIKESGDVYPESRDN
ncbi:MAG: hypothetical protein HYV47_03775 [Candidatus Nealsonbacteria bacterium]|nr:hypothetical protein [Candidatus Nealsonbacteria bacterium]